MAQKPEVLFEWNRPQELAIFFSDILLKQAKKAIPRLLAVTALLLFALYLFINYYLKEYLPPEEMDRLTKPLPVVFLLATGMALYTFWIAPLVMRRSKTPYVITEDYIATKGSKPWRLKWARIDRYSVGYDEIFPEVVFITLYSRKLEKRIAAPKGELSAKVLETIGARIPLVDEAHELVSQEPLTLSNAQWTYLWALTITYSLCFGSLLNRLGPDFKILFLIVFVLGPGTLGMLILVGRKLWQEKQHKAYAIAFNMLATFITMFTLIVLRLADLMKEAGS